MPPTHLLKLVAALLDDVELREEFNDDPDDVMKRYQLDATERARLMTMDPTSVAAVIAQQFADFKQEVQNAAVAEGEFPPCSEDYMPEVGTTGSEYPAPTPGVYRIRPTTAKKADVDAVGSVLELAVTGKSFTRNPDATAKVRRVSDGVVWSVSSDLFGTFRCSRLRVVVSPNTNAGETELQAGAYQVVVENNGVDIERPRPNPTDPDFTIEA